MKIAIVSAVYYPMINGVAVFSHNLAVGLANKGNEVIVICPSFTGKKSFEKEGNLKVNYLRSIRLPLYPDQINKVPDKKMFLGKEIPRVFYKNGIWCSPAPYPEVKKILKKFRPDVIHSQTCDPIGLAASFFAREHKIPFITTGHTYPDTITGQLKALKFVKKPLDLALTNYLVDYQRHSDYATMPTEMAIEDLILKRRRKFKVPFEALSNGVDLTSFRPGLCSDEIYRKYKIPKDRPILLYVGRVDPEKSISTVLEAFSKTVKDVPKALLVIVGDGIDKNHLEDYAKALEIKDSVLFTGKILPPDLYEIYKVGDLFVTASEIETQGVVLVEAAATGLPIIAVNKGAVGEICQNEKNGFLCKPGGDIDGIALGMTKILTDEKLRKKFSKNSLEISKKHDLNNTLLRFEKIYLEAIEAKKFN